MSFPSPTDSWPQVWVKPELRADGRIYWSADSDSQLTKGLAALLVAGLSGCMDHAGGAGVGPGGWACFIPTVPHAETGSWLETIWKTVGRKILNRYYIN